MRKIFGFSHPRTLQADAATIVEADLENDAQIVVLLHEGIWKTPTCRTGVVSRLAGLSASASFSSSAGIEAETGRPQDHISR